MAKEKKTCSFCGRTEEESALLIAGLHGHICNTCVSQAYDIVVQEGAFSDKKPKNLELDLKNPKEIKSFLER